MNKTEVVLIIFFYMYAWKAQFKGLLNDLSLKARQVKSINYSI